MLSLNRSNHLERGNTPTEEVAADAAAGTSMVAPSEPTGGGGTQTAKVAPPGESTTTSSVGGPQTGHAGADVPDQDDPLLPLNQNVLRAVRDELKDGLHKVGILPGVAAEIMETVIQAAKQAARESFDD